MKYLAILLFAIGCSNAVSSTQASKPCTPIHDTVLVPTPVPCNIDSYQHVIDSFIVVNDTLAKRLLHSRLVISNVKYYVNICNRKPSQDKFLRGWINRVVN